MAVLGNSVLILNKGWYPIRIQVLKRSLILVFRDKASIVDPDDYAVYNWEKWQKIKIEQKDVDNNYFIQTTRGIIKVPEVIILNKYDKIPQYRLKLTKRNIFMRDNFCCQYSGKKLLPKESDIDHIIPKSRGGKTNWTNLVVTSKELNRKKGNKTPEEYGLKLIKQPLKPKNNLFVATSSKETPKSWSKFINH